MKIKKPAVSVIMPVYNGGSFLKESIESILRQTFEDFELLIFNDGSTDETEEIIREYEKVDKRIWFHNGIENKGIVRRLNEGLEKAKGKYIARMDHDDVSLPDRFEKQFTFMERNPDVIICGSIYEELGKGRVIELPEFDEEIKLKLLSITPFCHPTVFLRADVLRQFKVLYSVEYFPAEDHALWVDLAAFGAFHNLSIPLVQYRIHENNTSRKERSELQKVKLVEKQKDYIKRYFQLMNFSSEEIEALHKLFHLQRSCTKSELQQIGRIVKEIFLEADRFRSPKQKMLSYLFEKYFYRCTTSTGVGLKAFVFANKYINSISPINNAKLLLKSIIRYKPSKI